MSRLLQRAFELYGDARYSLPRLWILWVALAVPVGAMAIGTQVGLDRLWERWHFSYDHAFLVVGMSAWLAIRALRDVRTGTLCPSVHGGVALVLTIVAYNLFELLDFTLGMQAMLPLILLAAVATIGGLNVAFRLTIPALFLYFAVPIWDLAITPLQWTTIEAVSAALRSTGFTAFIEGSLVHIPAGTFEIAEGCSGVAYFMVGLALATFYALVFLPTWGRRFLLIAVAGVAAVLSNWVRVYSLVVIGDLTEMKHYVIAESHDGFGWLVFVLVMAPVMIVGRVLEAGTLVRTALPLQTKAELDKPYRLFVAACLAAAIIVAPGLLRAPATSAVETRTVRVLPDLPGGWSSIATAEEWNPNFLAPDRILRIALSSPTDTEVDVFVAFYARQRPAGKLLARSNTVHPAWQATSATGRRVSLGAETRKAQQLVLSQGGRRRVVWYWYLVGGVNADSSVKAKLLELWALARGRRDGAVIAVSAPCDFSCDDAESALARYLELAGRWTEDQASRGTR